ncbi:plastocyanin/azurin family copper-binding protein [Mucilaginibacter myungsuensis]|uniref:Cupredoxin domain-containing protein n=1 Tax=Mucilaginibacter myungsuensis TaxID=649104 RepID=A0A929PWC4_9SPHI|nr:plastocyanin/azurin family copper-binding protein [Mucilaginibacter myungsuensis]MBE9661926.1 cupredoxin domain-containing protein [Mucilaginibacter myungsuensis]MDN3599640.1 plastocyanin/azurin family copper-binding protein [Mucilaginibacter myungsuensis]
MKAIIKNILLTAAVAASFGVSGTFAQNTAAKKIPTEQDYYRIVTLPTPEGVELEVGGLALMPNGDLGVATRRGDVYIIQNPYQLNGALPYYKKFANGLHEILGLAYRDGSFYCVQRGELTKLTDKNHDGKADSYETVYAWPVSGNYHEYSYGPVVMPNGNMMVNLNVGFDGEWWRGKSLVPWRAWTLEISPDGTMQPYATGLRSPAGQGTVDGKYFYAENQGDWVGSGYIMQLDKGDFAMHPAGLRWAADPSSPVRVRTEDIYTRVNARFNDPEGKIEDRDPNRPYKTLAEVSAEVKGMKAPAVWLPHSVMGTSTSSLIQIPNNDSFGPFAGQVLVGDQGQSRLNRVFLEQVKGQSQGAAFTFREGFESGVLRLAWGNDNTLFVGQTSRGWGSKGQKNFGLERVVFSKQTPFEMKAVRAMADGFEIEFTQPVNKKSAADPDAYGITGFTYKYHPVYGSNTIREKTHIVNAAIVSEDGLKVRLVADSLREKYVHEIKLSEKIVSANEANAVLHPVAYYTLNNIPDGTKLNVPKRKPTPAHNMAGMDHGNMDGMPAKSTAKAAPVAGVTLKKNQTTMPAGWTKADQSINLSTKPGLKYDITELTVKAGSKIKLTFTNGDDMPHNVVFVPADQGNVVGELALKLGLQGVKLSHIPNSPKVLYNTTLVGPGSNQTIYFVAPTKPGTYEYVCTVPGHYLVMKGKLIVQ